MKLKNKVAIITGAGAGIGKATANLFAKEGAEICCNSISQSALSVADDIIERGGEAIFVQGDVSNKQDARTIIEETINEFEKIDIVFNNAGIVLGGTIDSISTKDWDRTMAVNVRGVYLVSKYAIPYLKKTKGCIINNASSVAFKGVRNRAAYTASKGAVLSMTRAMASDYLQDNIRINAICPAWIKTPPVDDMFAKDPNIEKIALQHQPIGRLGRPEEIAQAVLWLCSDKATFMVGAELAVDGGYLMV